MTKLTVREVQRRQRKLLHHEKLVERYNGPFNKIHELMGALWNLESLSAEYSDLAKRSERIEVLLGACVLHLVDYCNAKQINFANLLEKTLSGIELARQKEKEKLFRFK